MTFEPATKFKPDADAPFAAAVEAGLRAAELWTGPDILANHRDVAARAKRFPLRYSLHFPNRRDLTPQQLAQFVELYRALDCRSFTIHELEYDRYSADLARLAPDLVPAVENSMLDPPEFERWAETRPSLTLDVEHAWLFTLPEAGLDDLLALLRKTLAKHSHKLRHVHLPGYWPGEGEHRPLHHSPCFAGAALSLLAEFEFTGMVVSEADVEYQTTADMRRDVNFVAAWRADHVRSAAS